ncbi:MULTISPECIES: hypothetical protein [unclassified Pantoea]|uniref:hypothetical protein n=1 Tax=unclassified Pantoea TaxID=2630326 RepID=UPI001232B92D|nr:MULTISPECIES: hypothetical protein [unclassified Pantoea]KAA5935350.1 hypothetical protein F3I57_23340 [Pantoea sp. VH_3]KAA5976643.1 hypothetical protein F3I48_23040 [Pantoea sp. M_3]
MHPHDFIRKNIISTLLAEGVAAEDARGGGAEAALSYYRRCSQASRKGRMFDDLLHEARQWVRFRSCSGGRRKAARSRQGSLL